MAGEGNKLTLRRLEGPVQKFVKVALPTDLERLQKHHNNILKQLRANIREMETSFSISLMLALSCCRGESIQRPPSTPHHIITRK
ncbi:hypothetical protein CRUP_034942 [Coryphaenoides rupestris]|nr:hypothetical protein CRUP_034942 [Coryphaenoides rupestris]